MQILGKEIEKRPRFFIEEKNPTNTELRRTKSLPMNMNYEFDPFGLSLEEMLVGLDFRCDEEALPKFSARQPSEDSFDHDYTIFKELRQQEVAEEARRQAALEAQKELDRLEALRAIR